MLAFLFFLIALIYAAIGFGGGSSYTALLALWGVPVAFIPVISLSCNLLVTSRGSVGFARAGWIPWRLILPLLAGSIPAAFLGGMMRVRAPVYMVLLGLSLLATGAFLLLPKRENSNESLSAGHLQAAGMGVALGLLSGVVGIGGGIFLSPILQLNRWANAKQSAACASLFIFLNSASGLVGQLSKPGARNALMDFWFLLPAVAVGGVIGHHLIRQQLPSARIRQGTALLVLFAGGRLLWNTLG